MKRTLICLALGLRLVVWADPASEARENERWVQEVRTYAETQPPEVQRALRMILQDVAQLSKLDPHKAHDALQATLAKLDRARVQPEGAVARERLDAPVGNFGEVEPGRLFRGAQPSPQGLRWLKEQGINLVIILREPGVEETNYPNYSRADYLTDIKTLGMEYLEIVVKDRTVPTPEQIERFLAAADTPKKCFFHCSAGVGRTGIMAGIYKRWKGTDSLEAVELSKRFQLSPATTPDHALQASLLANYPLPGRGDTVDLPWGVPGLPNPVGRGKSVVLPAGSSLWMDLADPAPALTRLVDLLKRGGFLRLGFRSRHEVNLLASLARVVPVHQKMGFLELRELGAVNGPGLTDLDLARHLLGPVPFEVRCGGLTVEALTPEKVEQLAELLNGKAEVIDLNLPDGQNPSESVLRKFYEHGLVCRVRFTKAQPKSYWDNLELGYLADEG